MRSYVGGEMSERWVFSLKISFQICIEIYVDAVFSPRVPQKPQFRQVSVSAVLPKHKKKLQQKKEKRS